MNPPLQCSSSLLKSKPFQLMTSQFSLMGVNVRMVIHTIVKCISVFKITRQLVLVFSNNTQKAICFFLHNLLFLAKCYLFLKQVFMSTAQICDRC